jgi:uncharacterized membrane protein
VTCIDTSHLLVTAFPFLLASEVSMTPPAAPAERLHTLDTLRGIAALSVVFWHWQHFFYD